MRAYVRGVPDRTCFCAYVNVVRTYVCMWCTCVRTCVFGVHVCTCVFGVHVSARVYLVYMCPHVCMWCTY